MTYSSHPNHAARAAHAKAKREFKTYDVSYIVPKRRKAPKVIAAILAVVIIVAALFFSGALSSCSAQETVAEGTEVEVTVPDGASTKDIAQILYDAKLIGTTDEFTSAVDRAGASTSLKPGTYQLVGGTSADDLVSQMEQGPQTDTLTIPEGSTLSQIAKLVAEATDNRVSASAFKKQAKKASAYVKDYPFVKNAYKNSLEGFLFPKTYQVSKDDDADAIIRMMLDQYRQEVSSLDYSTAKKHGLSKYDVLILASMIEKEAAADNRATVSSVFYNRLDNNMALQSDATIAYIVGHEPTASDLSTSSPYNTYLNTGLPAGPICSPGLESLEAACNPENTDYLYFYFAKDANGDMQYYFSKTYKQHQAAIKKAEAAAKSSSSDSGSSSENG
ncbi:MAG: endolytic transglycosylase MltG [Eggerthellaceae bacterium]|jgi:UPF0755 protein